MGNVILIGFMGTGKSTIGKALAATCHLTHLDLDTYLEEQEGCAIADVFREKGESYFRDRESALLKEVLQRSGQVISTGGGVVLRQENREIMLQKGLVISLHADVAEIVRRVSSEPHRPLLAGNPAERVQALFRERAGLYDFAPVHIDTTGKSVDQIVKEIEAAMVEEHSFRGE